MKRSAIETDVTPDKVVDLLSRKMDGVPLEQTEKDLFEKMVRGQEIGAEDIYLLEDNIILVRMVLIGTKVREIIEALPAGTNMRDLMERVNVLEGLQNALSQPDIMGLLARWKGNEFEQFLRLSEQQQAFLLGSLKKTELAQLDEQKLLTLNSDRWRSGRSMLPLVTPKKTPNGEQKFIPLLVLSKEQIWALEKFTPTQLDLFFEIHGERCKDLSIKEIVAFQNLDSGTVRALREKPELAGLAKAEPRVTN